jgi:hypothetical protein
MDLTTITYTFQFEDHAEETFRLQLDCRTCELIMELPAMPPAWTALTFHQCPNCPLDAVSHPQCPLSARVAHIATKLGGLLPYQTTYLTVKTEDRTFSQSTSIQSAAGSLMGLVMAASGCPHTAFFKPMARFHLPLASTEETIYRSVSMYLLAQYFRHKAGQSVDFELKGLERIYEQIHTVNVAVAERLLAASKIDSSVDAVVQLDLYAITFLGIPDQPLEEIRPLFDAFFKQTGDSDGATA